MQAATQLTTVLLLAVLVTGCVGTANVVFDERADFSKYQTWNWLVRDGPSVDVNDGNAVAVEAELARLIERWLLDRGFHRTDGLADFYVTYQLVQRRHEVVVNEPSAIYELSSLHASPSYLIQGNRQTTHPYSELRLAIAAIRSGEGTLWQATFSQFEREYHAVKLDGAVAMLLERFPRYRSISAERWLADCAAGTPEIDGVEDPTGHEVEASPAASCPDDAADSSGDRLSGGSVPTSNPTEPSV